VSNNIDWVGLWDWNFNWNLFVDIVGLWNMNWHLNVSDKEKNRFSFKCGRNNSSLNSLDNFNCVRLWPEQKNIKKDDIRIDSNTKALFFLVSRTSRAFRSVVG
jgi:hypothetical protein